MGNVKVQEVHPGASGSLRVRDMCADLFVPPQLEIHS